MLPDWIEAAKGLTLPAAVLTALFGTMTVFIRTLPHLQRVKMEGDNSLRGDLFQRVAALEAEIIELRKAMDRERTEHRAAFSDVEHDLRNESASLDAMILLAKANPEKLIEQIPLIEERRKAHRQRMAAKHGAREGAAIAVARSLEQGEVSDLS